MKKERREREGEIVKREIVQIHRELRKRKGVMIENTVSEERLTEEIRERERENNERECVIGERVNREERNVSGSVSGAINGSVSETATYFTFSEVNGSVNKSCCASGSVCISVTGDVFRSGIVSETTTNKTCYFEY